MDADRGTGKSGDDSGLPPQAPAYDLRTGEPLDAARADAPAPSGDFTATDLGIWAPSSDATTEPATRAATVPEVPSQYGAAGYQPTPPPGFGGAAPTAARQPTTPPGYQVPFQSGGYPPSSPGFQPPGFSSPGFPPSGNAPTAQQPGPPAPSRRGPMMLAGVAGVLVVVVAVLVAVLLFGGSPQKPVASTTTGNGSPGSGTSQSSSGQGTTGQSQGSSSSSGASGSSNASQVAFLHTVDGILTQSASGRQQVISVVNGVVNGCSVTPENASATIRQVIVNRQSVLGQANALSAPDAATATVKADLVQALNASIEANRGYQRWLDNLYTTYFNAAPVGCPNGQAPTDSNYDAATAASGRATTAKQNFVAAYNPLASAAGLRTWQESEF